jgi:hypothetical protein
MAEIGLKPEVLADAGLLALGMAEVLQSADL